jgi:protein TonB
MYATYADYYNYRTDKSGEELSTLPVLLTNTEPAMPASLSTLDIDSTVTVMFIVNKDGVPVDITVTKPSEYDALNQSAVDGVSKWRFKPGIKKGVPVNTRMQIPIQFKSQR